MWGSCFWLCTPAAPSRPPPHMLTNNLLTHNLPTHNFLTYNSHTTCSHNLSTHTHTPYSHTTCSHTQLARTQLVLTQLTHTQLAHTPSLCVAVALGRSPCRWALMALGWLWWRAWAAVAARCRRPELACHAFAWQAWHLVLVTVTLRGRRGTWRHRPSLCVAGVALMALDWLRWRAWAAVAVRCRRGCWRGRRGTW